MKVWFLVTWVFGEVLSCTGWLLGPLAPRPGIRPRPPAVVAWGLDHWAAREFPVSFYVKNK